MQAHTLGEVGILVTFLIRVYSGTIVPIFVEIGSYLTDKEQKISWHSTYQISCGARTFEQIGPTAGPKVIW